MSDFDLFLFGGVAGSIAISLMISWLRASGRSSNAALLNWGNAHLLIAPIGGAVFGVLISALWTLLD